MLSRHYSGGTEENCNNCQTTRYDFINVLFNGTMPMNFFQILCAFACVQFNFYLFVRYLTMLF
jgi:hypothetical protein